LSGQSETSHGLQSGPKPGPYPGVAFGLVGRWRTCIAPSAGGTCRIRPGICQPCPSYTGKSGSGSRCRNRRSQRIPSAKFGARGARTSCATQRVDTRPSVREVLYRILETLAGDAQRGPLPPHQTSTSLSSPWADAVRCRLDARAVPDALAVSGTLPYERTGHSAPAFNAEPNATETPAGPAPLMPKVPGGTPRSSQQRGSPPRRRSSPDA
jgi:hypothetical protein